MQNFLSLLTTICCELNVFLQREEQEEKKTGNSFSHQICLIHVCVFCFCTSDKRLVLLVKSSQTLLTIVRRPRIQERLMDFLQLLIIFTISTCSLWVTDMLQCCWVTELSLFLAASRT